MNQLGGLTVTPRRSAARGVARAQLRAEEFRRRHPPQPPSPRPTSDAPAALPPVPAEPSEPHPPPPQDPPPSGALQPQSGRGELDGPDLDAQVQARAWLLANREQLRQDLALGAGPAVDDLAGLAGVPVVRRARFGRLLQRQREHLLFARSPTLAEAARAMRFVGDLVLADPVLRPDAEAVLAAW